MHIESLYDRRRNDRIPANVVHKLHRIFNSFFATYTVSRTTERKIQREILEKTDDAGTLVDTDTRQLANTNARVRQRRDLRARQKVEAVFVVVLVYKDLRRFFRRDGLLNVVGEDLTKSEVRRDVHISRGDETVFEVVNAVNVETRSALIRIRSRCFWSKDAILDRIETGVEIR